MVTFYTFGYHQPGFYWNLNNVNIQNFYTNRDACAISDPTSDTGVLTGGQSTQTRVARYNLEGLVETLPSMNNGRARHGCGSYLSNNKVVLLVAGGDALEDTSLGGTTEKFITGEDSWTLVGKLPRSLYWISGATLSMNNKIYIFGGDEGAANRDVKDIMVFDADKGAWENIGEMNQGRYRHATSIIEADPEALCGTT